MRVPHGGSSLFSGQGAGGGQQGVLGKADMSHMGLTGWQEEARVIGEWKRWYLKVALTSHTRWHWIIVSLIILLWKLKTDTVGSEALLFYFKCFISNINGEGDMWANRAIDRQTISLCISSRDFCRFIVKPVGGNKWMSLWVSQFIQTIQMKWLWTSYWIIYSTGLLRNNELFRNETPLLCTAAFLLLICLEHFLVTKQKQIN